MEKYFGNAYRCDPGIPHTDSDRFVNIWIRSIALSTLTWVNPYMWQLSNRFKYSFNFSAVAKKNKGTDKRVLKNFVSIESLFLKLWKILSQVCIDRPSGIFCYLGCEIMDCLFYGVPSGALEFLFLHVLFFFNYHRLKYYLFADNIK